MGRQESAIRDYLERRERERRESFTSAAIHHARQIERRERNRRAADIDQVNAWESKFHAARMAAQIGVD